MTKTDMVDPELLELAVEDISEFLKGTFLEGAPLFPVSSQTGEGVDNSVTISSNRKRNSRPAAGRICSACP